MPLRASARMRPMDALGLKITTPHFRTLQHSAVHQPDRLREFAAPVLAIFRPFAPPVVPVLFLLCRLRLNAGEASSYGLARYVAVRRRQTGGHAPTSRKCV